MRSRLCAALMLAGALIALDAAPARAQHCHIDVPTAAPTTARTATARTWWATVSTVITVGAGHVADDASDYRRVARGYQGAALVVAAGWRRLGARLALGGYRVGDYGTGLDDARGAASVELTPRGRLRAGLSGAIAVPTGDADAGRGMGHVMLAGGAWARLGLGAATLEASGSYARALGDGAEHAAHLHGSDLWPLIDPMNAVEVAGELTGAYAVVRDRLAVRASVLAAEPIDRGERRVVASAGVRLDHGALHLDATIARPVVGDPFVARGQLEVGYRF